MDTRLHDSVLSYLRESHPTADQGGPLTFAVLIDKCINLSVDAISSLKTSIEELKLSEIQGENVEVACRRVLCGLKRLENNRALPHDTLPTIFTIFKTSSVEEFTDYVNHWDKSLMFLDRSQHPTYTEVLTRLERKYKNLCLACKWHGTSQQDSVFTAGSSKNERGENPSRQPTDKDKISDNPIRHQRVIYGKKMFFCLKCIRRGTTEKGRWNTSHHTDGHLPWG